MHGTLGHMACSLLDSSHSCSIAPPPKRARFYPTPAIAQVSGAGATGSCLLTRTESCIVGSLVAATRISRKRKLRAHSNRVPCIQLDGLDWLPSGGRPPKAVVEAVKAALVSHGVFTVEGHGVPMGTLMRAREESLSFFDLPLQEKQRCAVHGMERNRGYEIYPHHQRFLEQWTEICSLPSDAHPEPSAVQGIVCERFCCGPPTVCEPDGENEVAWTSEKFYNSEYGQVFFPPNVWPDNSKCTKLRPALLDAFQALERFSEAVLMLLAAAVDMEPQDFQQLMFDVSGHPRHASMLQVCNYPSLLPRALRPTELSEYQLRAKAHQDFGAFTLLARCPGTDSGKLQCGKSGALEVKLPSGKWMCVPARTEELTVMPGTLMEYLTAGRCPGVMHRVTNPPPKTASASRRLSLTFVVKPDYTAAAVPPGSALASTASTPTLGDLWRVGWQEKQRLTGAMPHSEAVQHFRRHRQDLRKRLLLET